LRHKLFIVYGNTGLLQPAAHFPVPNIPGVHEFSELSDKSVVMIVDIQTHDVDVLALVFGGKLDAGNDLRHGLGAACVGPGMRTWSILCSTGPGSAALRGGSRRLPGSPAAQDTGILYGLLQSVYSIMVREGKGGQSLFHGIIHQLRGGKGAV
jgi:hypothetical protein